ncbi:hypothetical protein AURDEDRAFT_187531 [Auricularia subglabra TFB-10046 SS5]|uniref:Uncharacterized protein n=1 Tax=Auricularia subglabra (strain TFB-10046 / SS5) TaxID=717982 RepID=J0WX45_AURST|nr:hypothetical protein AURDEDRAFT_187531 [Auricularia subglabra TFB-10046 SS5]
MTRLADELLDWILSPPLHVPDALFADPGPVSPFSRATYSASDVLLVCKSWMRVATPALYATVVIRSTAQAQALALALSRNPRFGRYVKKLRLEGVYGQYSKDFMPLMTEVTDLCLGLSVRGSDSITRLVSGLKTLNPRRVILTLPPVQTNAKYPLLLLKISGCILCWSRLASPFIDLQALSKSAALKTVHYPLLHWETNALLAGNPNKLLENPSITILVLHLLVTQIPASQVSQEMQSVPASTMARLHISLDNRRPCKLGSLLPKKSQTVARTAITSNPFYHPLAGVSRDVRLEIWSRIFSFAMESDCDVYYEPSQAARACITGERINKRTVRSLLRVSREFNIATLRAVSRRIHIENCFRLQDLGAFFSRNQALGAWVRAVSVVSSPGLLCGIVEPIFAVTTGVCKFTADALRPALFPAVRRLFVSSGLTLRKLVLVGGRRLTRHSGLSGSSDPGPYPGDTFKDLVALEVLDWDVEYIAFDTSVVEDSFLNLRSLTLRRSDPTFVDLIAQCSLPKISHMMLGQHFVGAAALFTRHGPKIQRLVAHLGVLQGELDACPALQSLELSAEVKPSAIYSRSHEHLQMLKLRWPTGSGSACLTRYRNLGKNLLPDNFPGLKTIVVMEMKEIWPLSEREIARSPWPKIAALFSERGVSLVDYTHRAWRPRLQVQ